MISLGTFYDSDTQANYNLYHAKLSEVKDILVSKYKDINPKDFIMANSLEELTEDRNIAKFTSIYHNNFIVTQDLMSDNPVLIDGFSRLFVVYDRIADKDIFIKDYIQITNVQAMKLILILNYAKTLNNGFSGVLDKGFAVFFYMKTGYNIRNHIVEHLIPYFDVSSPMFYHYTDWTQGLTINTKLLYENEHVFDDILNICKLYDLKFDESGVTEYYSNGSQRTSYSYAVPFATIMSKFRGLSKNSLNLEALVAFIKSNDELTALAIKKKKAYNVVSKTSSMKESFDIVWNKYFLPTIFGEKPKLTGIEKKKAFKKYTTKFKKDYKLISFTDICELGPNAKFYSLIEMPQDDIVKVDEYTLLGYREYTEQIERVSFRSTNKIIDINYCYMDVIMPEGEKRTWTRVLYHMDEAIYYVKIK